MTTIKDQVLANFIVEFTDSPTGVAQRNNSCTSWATNCSNWGGGKSINMMDIDNAEVQ